MDRNLVITWIPIKKTKERVVHQLLQHFINEGQWKVIFLCCLVKFSVINAHPPTSDGSLGD
jgi:hypothetical protein